MSYLDNKDPQLAWVPVPALASIRKAQGCVQCGSRLPLDSQGHADLSGKCANCIGWISDEDEDFDELED
jgi:hypothetical protein